MNIELWLLIGVCVVLLALIILMLYIRSRLIRIANRLKNIAEGLLPKEEK